MGKESPPPQGLCREKAREAEMGLRLGLGGLGMGGRWRQKGKVLVRELPKIVSKRRDSWRDEGVAWEGEELGSG